jgi:hypothetical protein
MRYDLKLTHELCQELGLRSHFRQDDLLAIELGEDCVLVFQNAEREEDCLVGFDGTPWHTHDVFMFADCRGHYTEMNYLDVVSGLKNGVILICEHWLDERLLDRCLIHGAFNDAFTNMNAGEEIRVRRSLITCLSKIEEQVSRIANREET